MTVTLSERPTDVVDGELAAMRSAVDAALGDRCKVEILGGEIIVPPMPRNLHMLIVTEVRHMLDDGCDRRDFTVTERAEFVVDRYNSPQPDVAVLARKSVERDLDATASPIAEALLVVEVTSPSNAHHDRKWGPRYKAYAKGLVPVYLLVDPHHADGPSFTLYTEPNGTRYQGGQTLPFGRSIRLPEPFESVVVDSAAFPAPGKPED
jgi:Uma2 family endonuclease